MHLFCTRSILLFVCIAAFSVSLTASTRTSSANPATLGISDFSVPEATATTTTVGSTSTGGTTTTGGRSTTHTGGSGNDTPGTGGHDQPPAFGARTIHEMGKNLDPIADDWPNNTQTNEIMTRGTEWHDIRSQRGNTLQKVATNFVSASDNTLAVIDFSGKVRVDHWNKLLSFRILVDGQVASPGEIMLTHGTHEATRSFSFMIRVDRGIHIVEAQWKVAAGTTAFMEDAAIQVRQSSWTNLAVAVPPKDVISTADSSWVDVPGLATAIWAEAGRTFTITASAESWMQDDGWTNMRATVNGQPVLPLEVMFTKSDRIASRTMNFIATATATGNQDVRIEWSVSRGAYAHMRARSLIVDVGRSGEPIGRAGLVNGGYPFTTESNYVEIPGFEATGYVPDRGEVVVTYTGEIRAEQGKHVWMALTIDGNVVPGEEVKITTGEYSGIHAFTFQAKHFNTALGPQTNMPTVGLVWKTNGEAYMGESSMTLLAKYGDLPDPSQIPEHGQTPGIEPMYGNIPVATVIWHVDHPTKNDGSTPQETEDAMFNLPNSSANFFKQMSNNKFTISMAGDFVYEMDSLASDYNEYYNYNGSEFTGGHQRSWIEAIDYLATQITLEDYDTNKDGVLMPTELAIVVVRPENNFTGKVNMVTQYDQNQNIISKRVGNLVVPIIVECNTGDPLNQIGGFSHELAHLLLKLGDLYSPTQLNKVLHTDPRFASLMGKPEGGAPMNGPNRFNLGWVAPFPVTQTNFYSFAKLDANYETYVLPRTDGGDGLEYFWLEFNSKTNNAGGMLIWHIVDGPDKNLTPKCVAGDAEQLGLWNTVGPNDHYRRSMRMQKPTINAAQSYYWDSDNPTLTDGAPVCPGEDIQGINTLNWADGTLSGYRVNWLQQANVGDTELDTFIEVQ